jgi:hypothetical protein
MRDAQFGVSSALLTIFFGAALANVLRGVPLKVDGYFFLGLRTNWRPSGPSRHLRWLYCPGRAWKLQAQMRIPRAKTPPDHHRRHHSNCRPYVRRTSAARDRASH